MQHSQLCASIIEGVQAEAGGRSIQELAAERDELLVALMQMIAARRGYGVPKPHSVLLNSSEITTLKA
jgi:hypothetical protein